MTQSPLQSQAPHRKPSLLRSILGGRCPHCGEGDLFSGIYRMNESCPQCGYSFLREDGYFMGSLVLTYFGTSAIMVVLLIALLFIAHWELAPTLGVCTFVIVFTNPIFFRLGRALWLSLDHEASLRAVTSASGPRTKRASARRVTVIDCDYVEPEFAAAFLLREGDEAAFVETNTTPAVPKLLSALAESGIKPEAVRYIIVTHVHLDHAGGASKLLASCPNAKILAHPRAARHLIDPSKLVASARAVYGNAVFEKLYGEILPIPGDRVQEMADESTIAFGSSQLRFLHTRGHAKHHFCILDPGSAGIFTGDSFGLRYPRLQKAGLFLFPSTSPTDFEPEEARKSAVRIARSGAETAFLTHFGEVHDLSACESQLLEGIDLHEQVLHELRRFPEESVEALTEKGFQALRAGFAQKLGGRGWNLSDSELRFLDLDLKLNSAGLVHVART